MRQTATIVALMMLAAASAFAATTIEALPGWAKVDQLDKAVEYAVEKDRPLVFLWTFRTTDCPICVGDSRKYMREKSLAGSARVLLYAEDTPPEALQKVLRQVKRPDNVIPIMFVATPDLDVVGFVRSGTNSKDLQQIIALSKQIMTWRKKASKQMEDAAALVEAGKFKAAAKIWEDVVKEDRKYTRFLAVTWGEKLDKDATDTKYFPDASKQLEGLEALANERLTQATEHFENARYAEAEKLLAPMVADGAAFDAVQKARELLAKVKEAKGRP